MRQYDPVPTWRYHQRVLHEEEQSVRRDARIFSRALLVIAIVLTIGAIARAIFA